MNKAFDQGSFTDVMLAEQDDLAVATVNLLRSGHGASGREEGGGRAGGRDEHERLTPVVAAPAETNVRPAPRRAI